MTPAAPTRGESGVSSCSGLPPVSPGPTWGPLAAEPPSNRRSDGSLSDDLPGAAGWGPEAQGRPRDPPRSLGAGEMQLARLAECRSGTGSLGAGGWLCWQEAAKERCQAERQQGGTTSYHRGLPFGRPAPLPSGHGSASAVSLGVRLPHGVRGVGVALPLEPSRCHQIVEGLSPQNARISHWTVGWLPLSREAESVV